MNHPVVLGGLAVLSLPALWVWYRATVRRHAASELAKWRRQLARSLAEASLATAEISEAAAAALGVLGEVVQGTGTLGVLESSVLFERVKAGKILDDKRAREALLLRVAALLQGIAGARELAHVMLPETRRDRALKSDVVAILDITLDADRAAATASAT
jgi:electron transfer flavoprotein alpha subunit